jgi:ketosteroid isomerase-like protein
MSLVLLALFLLACGAQAPKVDVEAERSAVLAADRAWSETPPDLDRFMANFTPDAVTLSGSAPPAEGLDAIRSSTSQLFGTPGFALSWSASTAGVSACGDLAYTIGSYEITSNDAAGNAQTLPGKYLTLWKKQADGQWKVEVDAPSENQPPPLPAPTLAVAEDSVKVDPDHYKVEFENDQVRVLKIKYGPGEKSVMHDHPASVVVFLSDQNGRFTLPDGTATEQTRKAGDVQWADAVTHLPENLSEQELDVILVELKTRGD